MEEASPRVMEVKGRNVITGLPKTIKLTSEEVRVALKEATGQIVDTVHGVSWKKRRRSWLRILWTEESSLPEAEPCSRGMDTLIEQADRSEHTGQFRTR